VRTYGPKRREADDPLDGLIRTILSQNTTDLNSHAAFASLKQRFPTWEEALAADPDDIADAIRHGGLAEIKSARIQEILAQIRRERGKLSLDFVCDLPVEEAKEHLLSFKGVGPKTAAIVLLFDCGMPLFPVDTHVFRVTSRLGWLPEGATPEKAHDLLRELVPEELHFQLHLNLVQHGRETCHARNPDCASCPLKRLCRAHKSGEV
jgi:endonuclease-3